MKKLFLLLLAVAFTFWVLPLGVFIKPSQQKVACDGQRAICMCHVVKTVSDKAMEHGLSLANPAHQTNSSGGAGNYFVSVRPVVTLNPRTGSFFQNQCFRYSSPYLASLEYVPKA